MERAARLLAPNLPEGALRAHGSDCRVRGAEFSWGAFLSAGCARSPEASLIPSGRTDPEREGGDDFSETVLRAKYLDYCSARVADLLLRMTADEMYLLAQEAAGELTGEEGESLTYSEIVRLATDRIARKLSLPDYRSWAREYRANPETFDRELLGLWRSESGSPDPSAR